MAEARPLTATELLDLWERGRAAAPAERALTLARVAVPGGEAEPLASLTVGGRNTRLLELRKRLFGPDVPAVADCPSCDTPVELLVPTDWLRADSDDGPPRELARLATDDYEVLFRIPTLADLAELPFAAGPEALDLTLLERCVVEARIDGAPARAAELPPTVVDAVERRMEELDPAAELRLSLRCPECGSEWLAGFPIADFLWADLDRWARHLLSEIHALAVAYGWSEADILGMSAARRALYLELVGA
jgi:hypothetical protein